MGGVSGTVGWVAGSRVSTPWAAAPCPLPSLPETGCVPLLVTDRAARVTEPHLPQLPVLVCGPVPPFCPLPFSPHLAYRPPVPQGPASQGLWGQRSPQSLEVLWGPDTEQDCGLSGPPQVCGECLGFLLPPSPTQGVWGFHNFCWGGLCLLRQ